GPLPLKEVLQTASEIAEALEEAHKKNIIHRDLKPSNIMLTEQGHVKVMDFGLAKRLLPAEGVGSQEQTITASLTKTGATLGTLAYMSPEQLRAEEADTRSDIFSFGVTLYEMLTGVHPFKKAQPMETGNAILSHTPPPLTGYTDDAPELLQHTIRKMLAKEPDRRYQHIDDVRIDLKLLHKEIEYRTTKAPLAKARLPREKSLGQARTVELEETPAFVKRTSFIGREAEQAELQRLLAQVQQGQGALILIGGEPGVGKTRLAEELLSQARKLSILSLKGHCYEMEGAPPFIPFVEILEHGSRVVPRSAFREALGDAAPEVAKLMPELRRLFPDIPEPIELPPEQQRRYLFNSFLEFVERASRVTPWVLLLEDLHWADESTVLLLHHIAQQLHVMPVLIVGTYRDVELDVARPFAQVLETLVRQRLALRLTLKRLPEEGVAKMLVALSGQEPPVNLVQVIYKETEGNPFFVEEVFQHLSEEGKLFDEQGQWKLDLRIEELEVPEGVRLVIGRRLERSSEASRRVLTSASVIGRAFNLELLEALTDIAEDTLLDAIEEAERARLITSTSSDREVRYAFEHELIRQTLVSNLSLPRRQRMHLRVAEALERVYKDNLDKQASDLAHHLYQAGTAADQEKTVHYLTLAGEQALEAAAAEDALRHFENALSLQEVSDKKERADLLFKRGQAHRSLGQAEEALVDWKEALHIYEKLGDAEAVARISWGMSYWLVWLVRPDEAIAAARRGLMAVGEQMSADHCRLLASLGLALSFSGNYQAAEDMLTQSLATAEELADQRLLGEVLSYQTIHYWLYLKLREQVEAGKRSVELLRMTGDLWELAGALTFTVNGLCFLGELDEVAKSSEEAEPLATRLGHMGALLSATRSRAWGELMLTADVDEFEAFNKRDLELCRRAGFPWISQSYLSLGLVDFWRGRFEDAMENFQEAVKLEPPGTWVWAGLALGALFLGKAYVSDKDALDSLHEKMTLPRPGEVNTAGAWWSLLFVVEGLAVLGEREEAAKTYPLVVEAIGMGNMIGYHLALLQKVAGIAAAAGEEWEKAEQHYETALCQSHEIPHRLEQPEVRRWYARMLIDRDGPGDRDKAKQLLTEAIDAYQGMGMPKHVEMAEELLSLL
ncbi:protein kinase, partial [Acidobacteria bacterium AH-259-A15]|nr:protein kinase [Acidobacteria bacterium AH-259-A15]